MRIPSRALFVVVALVASTACSDSINPDSPFAGRWQGSNDSYSSVTLNIQQFGDSLTGTVDLEPDFGLASGTGYPKTFFGHVYGDSLSVLWSVPLTTGFANLQYAGHRSDAVLVGKINSAEPLLLYRR